MGLTSAIENNSVIFLFSSFVVSSSCHGSPPDGKIWYYQRKYYSLATKAVIHGYLITVPGIIWCCRTFFFVLLPSSWLKLTYILLIKSSLLPSFLNLILNNQSKCPHIVPQRLFGSCSRELFHGLQDSVWFGDFFSLDMSVLWSPNCYTLPPKLTARLVVIVVASSEREAGGRRRRRQWEKMGSEEPGEEGMWLQSNYWPIKS